MYRALMSSLVLGLLFISTRPADAALITVDPDAFIAGTDISNSYSGVTLSTVGGTFGASSSVYSINPQNPAFTGNALFPASTPTLAFGNDAVGGGGPTGHIWTDYLSVAPLSLRADFTTPTDLVQLDFISNNGQDVGRMDAFNAANVLVGSYTTANLALPNFETMTITRVSPDIAYVIAGSLSLQTGGLDHLRFDAPVTAVPEPSGFHLAFLGLLAASGMLFSRNRREQ